MRPILALVALLLSAFVAPLAFGAPARADWAILYYDKNGRLIELDRGREQGAGAGGAQTPEPGASSAQPEAPQADAESAARRVQERFVPGELIVANPPRGFDMEARALGFAIVERVSLRALDMDIYRLGLPPRASVPDALARLSRLFPGLNADANHLLELQGEQATAEWLAQALIGWRAPTADCGRGVRLGMIDGAVDVDHPALAGQDVEFRSFHSTNRRPAAAEHGTAIAAMMVGKAPWGGLLPAARLRAANIFEVTEDGVVAANVFALLKAVGWMVEERVHVINLSVAGSNNRVLSEILGKARAKGLVMVAAAGNGGRAAPPAYPAAYEHVIAVTAVDSTKHVYAHANQGSYIDFAAPGVEVWTAVPGGGRAQSGTSFAAPYVSVLAALEVARGSARGAAAARDRLRVQTLDLGTPGRDEVFGWGLVRLPRNCTAQALR